MVDCLDGGVTRADDGDWAGGGGAGREVVGEEGLEEVDEVWPGRFTIALLRFED